MKSRAGHAQGFTLIELVITLSLIAIMASIAIVSSDAHRNHSVDTIGKIIASDLHLARSVAIEQNTQWAIKFDLANNSYQFVYEGTSNPPTVSHPQYPGTPLNGYRVDLNRLIGTRLHQTSCQLSSVQLQSTGDRVDSVTFGPMGGTGPSTHQDTQLTLTSGSGRNQSKCDLTVSWLTGQTWINMDSSALTSTAGSVNSASKPNRNADRSRRGKRWGG